MMTSKRRRIVAAVLNLILCVGAAAPARARQAAASEPRTVLQKMVAGYAGLRSYQDAGSVRVFSGEPALLGGLGRPAFQTASSGKETRDVVVSFRTYFERPRLFRFEWKTLSPRAVRDSIIWSDGKDAYSWTPGDAPGKNEFLLEKELDLSSLVEEQTRASHGSAFFIPSLLMGGAGQSPFSEMVAAMTEVSLVGEEAVEGEACYVIKGKMSGVPWVLWIDKKSYLLRKTRTQYFTGSFHEFEAGGGKTLIGEETHREIKINERVPEEVFKFKPVLQTHDLDLTRRAEDEP